MSGEVAKSSKRKKKKNNQRQPISEIFQAEPNGEETKEVLRTEPVIEVKKEVEDNKEAKIKEMNLSHSFLETRFKALAEQLEATKSVIAKVEAGKSELIRKATETDQGIKQLQSEYSAAVGSVDELSTRLQNKLIVREKFEAEANELHMFLESKTKEYEELVNRKITTRKDMGVQTTGKMPKEHKLITIKE